MGELLLHASQHNRASMMSVTREDRFGSLARRYSCASMSMMIRAVVDTRQVCENREIALVSTFPPTASPAQRIIRYITIGGSRRKSVSQETAKQLVFKMKFMGLAVVFLVLNVHSPAQSAPTVILALPFTSALTASAFYSGLVATKEAALVGVGVSAASASTLAAAAVPAAAVAKVVAVKALGAGAAYYALTREAEEEK